MDLWAGFNQPNFGPALATEQPGFATAGEPFSCGAHGFIATDVHLHTDQIGTQLDPPAHWNEYGATISDVPASVSLRTLVVIDVTAQVAADPTYFATVADVEAHEAAHGRIPAGSAVFFRTVGAAGGRATTARRRCRASGSTRSSCSTSSAACSCTATPPWTPPPRRTWRRRRG